MAWFRIMVSQKLYSVGSLTFAYLLLCFKASRIIISALPVMAEKNEKVHNLKVIPNITLNGTAANI